MLGFHILLNNHAKNKELLEEHGLSILVEAKEKKILFDTGQSDAFLHNSKTMGIDMNTIDYIVLSHGHYDHTTGVKHFNFVNSGAALCLHPDALKKKYKIDNGDERYIGITWDLDELNIKKERIIFNREPKYIEENIMLSGEIPRMTDFEEIPRYFKIKENGIFKDDIFLDEQMLIIKTKRGIIIFLGCSHPGVINCIKYACKLHPNDKVMAVVGGMHLKKASEILLKKTIECLKNMSIEKVFPLHCTGLEAMAEMKKALGERCILCNAGDTIELLESI